MMVVRGVERTREGRLTRRMVRVGYIFEGRLIECERVEQTGWDW